MRVGGSYVRRRIPAAGLGLVLVVEIRERHINGMTSQMIAELHFGANLLLLLARAKGVGHDHIHVVSRSAGIKLMQRWEKLDVC